MWSRQRSLRAWSTARLDVIGSDDVDRIDDILITAYTLRWLGINRSSKRDDSHSRSKERYAQDWAIYTTSSLVAAM
jgi:hypothetical protein